MKTNPQYLPKPEIEELSPDLRYQLYVEDQKLIRRQNRKVKASWLTTGLICAPFLLYVGWKPLNDSVSIVSQTIDTANWISSLFQSPQASTANLASAVDNPNVMAFLDSIAFAEGTNNSYDLTYGYKKFDTSKPHDGSVVNGGALDSAAKGRYQAMPDTWKQYMGDAAMLPENQDKFAIAILKDKGVYDEIKNGNVTNDTYCKLGNVWASFGCNEYNQPTKDQDLLVNKWKESVSSRSGQAVAKSITPMNIAIGNSFIATLSNNDAMTNLLVNVLSKPFGKNVTGSPGEIKAGKIKIDRTGKYMLMLDTGRTTDFGSRIYNLNLMQDSKVVQSVEVVSGEAGSDPVPTASDFPGSKNPLPSGVYNLGVPEDIPYKSDMGSVWISINPSSETNTNGRSSFGFHVDENRRSNPGTAGCISPVNNVDINTIRQWVNDGVDVLDVRLTTKQEDIQEVNNDVVANETVTTKDTAVDTAEKSEVTVKRAEPDTFCIKVNTSSGSACGSGVAIDKNLILSAKHVTDDMTGDIIGTDGTIYNAQSGYKVEVISSNNTTDLSLIRVDLGDFTSAKFGNEVIQNQSIVSIGHSNGEDNESRISGTITSLDEKCGIPTNCYAITKGITPGFSGGGSFNDMGELIGINRSLQKSDETGRLVKLETIKAFLDQIKSENRNNLNKLIGR